VAKLGGWDQNASGGDWRGGGGDWIQLAQDTGQWCAVGDVLMNLWVLAPHGWSVMVLQHISCKYCIPGVLKLQVARDLLMSFMYPMYLVLWC
jgi:hypothetical protein